MDFSSHLKNMMEMVQKEFLVLVIGGLVIQFLSGITLGLLSGPLVGGYLLVILNWLNTGRRCEFNDIFLGMKRFKEFFSVFLLMLLIFCGFMFFLLPGIIMTVWWMYAILLIGDRNVSLGEAMTLSKEKVMEKGFFMHLVFLLMISFVPTFLLAIVAAIIPPLAVLHYFLFPLQCACLVSLYREQFLSPSAELLT